MKQLPCWLWNESWGGLNMYLSNTEDDFSDSRDETLKSGKTVKHWLSNGLAFFTFELWQPLVIITHIDTPCFVAPVGVTHTLICSPCCPQTYNPPCVSFSSAGFISCFIIYLFWCWEFHPLSCTCRAKSMAEPPPRFTSGLVNELFPLSFVFSAVLGTLQELLSQQLWF